jgi:hypothetical protein
MKRAIRKSQREGRYIGGVLDKSAPTLISLKKPNSIRLPFYYKYTLTTDMQWACDFRGREFVREPAQFARGRFQP